MKKLWIFLINTFEVNTRSSRVKMLRLANDHDARLAAAKDDPEILEIYNVFHALLLVYRSLMAQLTSIKGTSKGQTQTWQELLDDMANKWINTWEGMVFNFFPKGTPQATAIFPLNKKPFQSFTYDERMVAVDALHKTMLEYPELKDVAVIVKEKLDKLEEARQQQKESFGKSDFSGNKIEAQRLLLANAMDDNLCKLKIKFRSDLGVVENFFDLSLLRRAISDSDAMFQTAGVVEASITTAISLPEKLVVSANSPTLFSNNSAQAELQFFFSVNPSAADNSIKTSVLPSETAQGTAADAGWAPGAKYLIVKNLGTVTAEFEVQVTEAVEG